MHNQLTALPGIGLRHTFTTARHQRIGVVSHRTGRRDAVVYDPVDPDSVQVTIVLNSAEATVLGELLHTARIAEELTQLERPGEGLTSAPLPITPGSPYDGRPLA